MAAVAAVSSPSRSPKNIITKKPSIKKYKAPTPPKFKAEPVDCKKENTTCDADNSGNIELNASEIVVSNGKQNGVEKENEAAPSEGKGSATSIPDVCRTPRSDRSVHSNSSSNRSSPINRDRINAANSNGSPGGNVMTKAAIFETASPKRNTDPALMSMRDRKALFEKNKGSAIVPKAPFGMAPSIKALQGNTTNKDVPKKPALTSFGHPKIEPKPTYIVPTHSPHAGIKNKLGNMFSNKIQTTISEKEIADKVKKEREAEMKMLQNRFHKEPVTDFDRIDVENEDDDQSSEESPLMGGNHKSSMNSLAIKKPPPVNSPKIIIAPKGRSQRTDADDDDSLSEVDGIVGQQPPKRRSGSMDSQNVVSVLEDVKRIRVAGPKAGNLYPCLSDIEAPPTDSDNQQSCPASSLNTSCDSNQSSQTEAEDWGNTSFGRDLLKVVGVDKSKAKIISKDLSKGRKALRSKRRSSGNGKNAKGHNSSSDGANNEDLDDLLDDEDLDFQGLETESTGPTPPKLNKNGALPSNSFSYKKASDLQRETQFKSPLKTPPSKGQAPIPDETGKPLMHTVSFYRRQQSQGSQPPTPVRVVRLEIDQDDDDVRQSKQKNEQRAKISANETKRRVKELMDEVAKQNTVISQASQALNLCASTIEFSGSTEQAEGERLLLLASHRRQACLHEMQRVQVEGVSPPATSPITLNIQEVCLPLRREYIRQLNADGAVGHYLVCLVKCHEKVVATSLVKTTPELFAITFPDKIRMEELDADFKITIEVYALQASKEILPHDVKYHIATKKSGKLATPRKGARGADLRSPMVNASPGGPFAVRTPALQSHGYCIFGHHQVQRNSFSLNKACGAGPLEGTVKLKLTVERGARVFVLKNRPPVRGFLTMFEESGGFGAWHRRWCVLSGTDLSYWRYPDDEQKKTPMSTIELCTALTKTIGPAPRDLCARPHTLMLEVRVSASDPVRVPALETCAPAKNVRRHLLAADTKPERDSWAKALNEALGDARAQEEASNASE